MKNIATVLKKNKKVALVGLFFLIIFIGFSITNAIKVSYHRAETAKEVEVSKQERKTKEGSLEVDAVSLTDKQKSIIEKYDGKTKEIIQILISKPWVSQDNKNVITFHDNYFEESINGTIMKVPFAISAIEESSNGSDTLINTLVFETDVKTHVVIFTQMKAKSATDSGVSTLLSNTLFKQVNTAYSRVETFTKVTINGLNNEATMLLGNISELSTKLSEWCATHYPTMTTAVWNKNMSLSFNEKTMTVTTAFFLGVSTDDASNPRSRAPLVTVIFDKSANTYTFKM
ncbi:hypothetical protein [Arcanobacterium hippocoleae]|uniref:Uncharacterized protein n=1 Tax=Arcanobacterium hippocoleae TaxID=149017 RepID=A0ABU1T1L5_9ACTO|nr:hypothetical protein [Arcanobacterium hippocoleae]MDR6939237.1 hypothetical protein [Arcanobacterium hippocoleae]